MYLRLNMKDKIAAWGGSMNIKCHGFHLSDELSYDWAAKEDAAKKLFGMPIEYRVGGQYKANKKNVINFGYKNDGMWQYHLAFMHKLDKNWKAGMQYSFMGARMGSTQGPHQIGFSLDYKL